MRTELPAVKEVHEAICHDEDATDRGSEHAEVLTALRNHEPAAARQAMQQHFRRLLGSMIDITEELALEELRKKTTESRQRYLDSVADSRSA
jgi:DNA-binding FadR family transcriptional regulator